jgi:hypothetical protein
MHSLIVLATSWSFSFIKLKRLFAGLLLEAELEELRFRAWIGLVFGL